MSLIVIALGGNALGNTPEEQLFIVKKTAKRIVELTKKGYNIVLTHGNGPQVGMIYNNMSLVNMPFAECGSMSQGYIGYHLQQAIQNELKKNNLRKKCISIVTQVEVDKYDEAFLNPSKPIGSFYTKEEAIEREKIDNAIYKEDAGRGYRRVIASPKPQKIVEINTIKKLIKNRDIIITCGGGGIPVINKRGILHGVDAVIDKDKTSALLAKEINADKLVILTTVEKVRINFNTPNERKINNMSIKEAKQYIASGEFAAGSMLPKIEACLDFVSSNKSKEAIITSLTKAKKALDRETGTFIYKEENKNGKN